MRAHRTNRIQYASAAGAATSTVTVNREAILAAGSIHSPQILQVSGIGASSLLTDIGVTTIVDLPAVGENFQDHVLVATVASSKQQHALSLIFPTRIYPL